MSCVTHNACKSFIIHHSWNDYFYDHMNDYLKDDIHWLEHKLSNMCLGALEPIVTKKTIHVHTLSIHECHLSFGKDKVHQLFINTDWKPFTIFHFLNHIRYINSFLWRFFGWQLLLKLVWPSFFLNAAFNIFNMIKSVLRYDMLHHNLVHFISFFNFIL
jgi:hypothetical protein